MRGQARAGSLAACSKGQKTSASAAAAACFILSRHALHPIARAHRELLIVCGCDNITQQAEGGRFQSIAEVAPIVRSVAAPFTAFVVCKLFCFIALPLAK
jgi:hypothetical protein